MLAPLEPVGSLAGIVSIKLAGGLLLEIARFERDEPDNSLGGDEEALGSNGVAVCVASCCGMGAGEGEDWGWEEAVPFVDEGVREGGTT